MAGLLDFGFPYPFCRTIGSIAMEAQSEGRAKICGVNHQEQVQGIGQTHLKRITADRLPLEGATFNPRPLKYQSQKEITKRWVEAAKSCHKHKEPKETGINRQALLLRPIQMWLFRWPRVRPSVRLGEKVHGLMEESTKDGRWKNRFPCVAGLCRSYRKEHRVKDPERKAASQLRKRNRDVWDI